MTEQVKHEWMEIGNRRWCITRYCDGGCDAFQTKKNGEWKPAVRPTCTEQKK